MSHRLTIVLRKVAAIAPLLLLVVTLPTQVSLRCRFDGQLRTTCCCPADQADEDSSSTPTLEAACCCDREITAKFSPLADRSATDQVQIAVGAAAVVVDTVVLVPPEPRPLSRELARGRPRDYGPPLILLKQTFLI